MHIRHLEIGPDLDSIRNDPRFKDMLANTKARLGMAEAANPPADQPSTGASST